MSGDADLLRGWRIGQAALLSMLAVAACSVQLAVVRDTKANIEWLGR